MRCIITVIVLICIIYLVCALLCRKKRTVKQKGGYAGISNGDGLGTIIGFPNCVHKPIVIRLRKNERGEPHLDVGTLYESIARTTDSAAFIAGIKNAVSKPCGILGDAYANSSIYSVLSKRKMYNDPLFTVVGECNMDAILLKLCPSPEAYVYLAYLRLTLIAVMCKENQRYIVDEMIDVSQGDSLGNKNIEGIGKYIYMYGEDTTRTPNMTYPPLIDDYILTSELMVTKQGKRRTIHFDSFSRYIFDNDAVRGWYGDSKAAYRIMNPQYIRHYLADTGAKQPLIKVPPDSAKSKVSSDNIADIIPAGSVRQTIMLYLERINSGVQLVGSDILRAAGYTPGASERPNILNGFQVSAEGVLTLPNGIQITRDTPVQVDWNMIFGHISYITLLCGLANAFGNTTHDADYNTGIGDKYRYTANPICRP